MKMNRRDFLKCSALGGGGLLVGALVAKPSPVMAAQDAGKRRDGFALLTDTARCVGCRRCETACNRVNKLAAPKASFEDPGVFEEKRRTEANAYTVVNRFENPRWSKPVFVKKQCMHCAEPACASACLVGALKKTPEGAVIYDEDVCIGCRYCMTACPFYMPAFEYFDAASPAIRKCTMCYQRVHRGTVPACAEACSVEATVFGKRSQLIKLARERMSKAPGKYVDHIYGEHEAGGTDWLYISGVPFEELGLPADLGTTAYPEFTKDFLAAVPVVLVAWPALFGGLYAWTKRREQIARAGVPEKGGEKR